MSAGAGDLSRRFRDSLAQHPDLIPGRGRILIALSGGPDSMALLHLLAEVREELELELLSAHFDHGLRPDAAGEGRIVTEWSESLGVPCRSGRAGEELEPRHEELRRARYAFLRRVADEENADRIATGHQADDQAETVLFRMLRGTGLRGLAGIPRRRGRIVRPLLPFWRSEIERFLHEREISFLRDPANRDPQWARARIRTRLLPAMEESWEGPVRERLVSIGTTARRAERALEEATRHALCRCRAGPEPPGGGEVRLALERLRDHGPEMRGRILRRAARSLDVELSRGGTREGVEFISEGRSGGRIDLGGGLRLVREFDLLRLSRTEETSPDRPLTIEDAAGGRGRARIGGRAYRVRWGAAPADDFGGSSRFRVRLPLDRLDFPLLLRGWSDGDRIRLPAGARKVKRLFNDRRVPLSERARLPVLVAKGGDVLWIAGVARDAEMEPGDEDEPYVVRIDRIEPRAPIDEAE